MKRDIKVMLDDRPCFKTQCCISLLNSYKIFALFAQLLIQIGQVGLEEAHCGCSDLCPTGQFASLIPS